MTQRTAYLIRTARLLLRCWAPTDAPDLRAAIDRSDAHLRPFIPFMRDEPRTLAQTTQRLREHRGNFDLDKHHNYAIFDAEQRQLLGEAILMHPPGGVVREVGYWIHVDHCGRGYATEATAALTRFAFEVEGVDRVELQCETTNTGSVGVAVKLGFTHEATLRRRFTRVADDARVDAMVWTLFASRWRHTRVGEARVRAWDAAGELIPATSPAQPAPGA